MEIINRCLSIEEFRQYVKEYYFGSEPANKLVIHHTWKPTTDSWDGERSIQGLKNYYEKKGWPAGPHLFIAEEGIWLFSPMRKDGIHTAGLNHCSIGIEVVGDYDNEVWSGNTKTNALGAIKILMDRLNLTFKDIYFHRDVSSKTCPGLAITKEWLFSELSNLYISKPEFKQVIRNTTAPPPADFSQSDEMVLIPVPDWAKDAVDFVAKNKLFKIRVAEDVRHAVRFYRFYNLLKEEQKKQ